MNRKKIIFTLFLTTLFCPLIASAAYYPLPDFLNLQGQDPNVVVGRIIRFIVGLSGTLALVYFIYGGTLWLISAGNPNTVDKGRNAMIWSAIGLTVILTSYILVNYVFRVLGV